MQNFLGSVVHSWGTKMRFSLLAYLWFLLMLLPLTLLSRAHLGTYLVPPFLATLSILHLLPDSPIAQPYAVIVGSVGGASIGVLLTLVGYGPVVASVACAIAFALIHLLRAYHPPGVALALYPALLHTHRTFPVFVVLPFTVVAVGSAMLFSRISPRFPKYPLPLGSQAPNPWGKVD